MQGKKQGKQKTLFILFSYNLPIIKPPINAVGTPIKVRRFDIFSFNLVLLCCFFSVANILVCNKISWSFFLLTSLKLRICKDWFTIMLSKISNFFKSLNIITAFCLVKQTLSFKVVCESAVKLVSSVTANNTIIFKYFIFK